MGNKSYFRNLFFKIYICSVTNNEIRIKLCSFELLDLNSTCKTITKIVSETGAILSGPIPLPTKKNIFCVLRSPHVNKDSREHFEIRSHRRLFCIKNWKAETMDALMAYEVPSGVEVT